MAGLTKATLAILAASIVFAGHQALSQTVRLNCEVKHYGEYSHGEARAVAESWIPPLPTHVISAGQSAHVEWGLIGSARAVNNRIYFQYPLFSGDSLSRVVKYTYLNKTGVLIGFMATEAGAWGIRARGKCRSSALTPKQAAEYF